MREGIKTQEKVQLQKSSGLNPTSNEFQEAYKGQCEAWDSYFDQITETDHNTKLTEDIFENPTSHVSETCLYLYTCDGWLFSEINSASREGDQAKLDTLGPFALVFSQIIAVAGRYRTDIDDLKEQIEKKGVKLYRGTGLTDEELLSY